MHLYVGSNQLTDDTVGAPELGRECKLTYLGTLAHDINSHSHYIMYLLSIGVKLNFRPQWELTD